MFKYLREKIKDLRKTKMQGKDKLGITLIALVITIIVLLILAGVSISMLSGDNSILQRAADAKEKTDISNVQERIKIAYLAALTAGKGQLTEENLQAELEKEFGTEKTAEAIDKSTAGKWKITIDGVEYETDAGANSLPKGAGTIPYLPTGFRQLPGTNLSTGSTGGLVITDATGTENGNEYVWVEVPNANLEGSPTYGPDYSAQGLTATKITGDLTDDQKTKIEAALWAYINALITKSKKVNTNLNVADRKTTTCGWKDEFYEGCGVADEGTYNTKYKNMLKKVYNNGGFWIGRYEAGIERPEGSTEEQYLALARQNYTAITNSSPKAVSKKDCIPYNWITCSEAQSLAERAGGNLMFGIQWDLTLRYLQATNAVDQTGLTSNSEGWGNYKLAYNLDQQSTHGYKGTISGTTIAWNGITSGYSHPNSEDALSTGATERNAKKNIYDLAGNIYEWTLEYAPSYSGYPCAGRGGSFGLTGSSDPASYRVSAGVTDASSYVGLRVSL